MFIPCYEHCYLRFRKQYTQECDTTCAYAEAVLKSKSKDKVIAYLLDLLEEEHMGAAGKAANEVKDKFDIDI